MSKAEVLNDKDGELINFYCQLHKHGRKLVREVNAMPYSRRVFTSTRNDRPRGTFARATRFWYLNRVAFGAKRDRPTFGVKATGRTWVLPPTVLESLDATIERLRGVLFESLDVTRLIELYDRPATLFYVDPPYYNTSQSYACQFTEQDHTRLAQCLEKIKGMFLLSYNDCQEVRYLYSGYSRLAVTTRYSMGRNSSAGRKSGATGSARELLISNRPLAAQAKQD